MQIIHVRSVRSDSFAYTDIREASFALPHINAVSVDVGIYAVPIICAGRPRTIQGPTRSPEEATALRQELITALQARYAPTQLLSIMGWLIVLPSVAEVYIGSGYSPSVLFSSGTDPLVLTTRGAEESQQVYADLKQALKLA